jgi:hypothetical protein
MANSLFGNTAIDVRQGQPSADLTGGLVLQAQYALGDRARAKKGNKRLGGILFPIQYT